MKTTTMRKRFMMTGLLALLIPIVLFTPQAYGESYVAGQFGVTLPQSLGNGTATQDGIGGLDISDQSLKSSALVGAKLGHYFTKARWMGIETGLSYTTPHVEEGSITFSGPGGSVTSPTLSGLSQRIITWDIDVIFRYPGYRLQPYLGIGPSLYFASLNGPTAPPGQSTTSIGFNVEGGLRYYITRRWALFGEGKYNWARMDYSSNHSDPNADPFGFRATYSALGLSVGISYHF
ncbi:MAG TPA: outer membrane beta-barrel protein [Nitrospiraceae bacterium]|nr:outer membrane beta-barrel protein [Nitrospiraceae bacterium]